MVASALSLELGNGPSLPTCVTHFPVRPKGSHQAGIRTEVRSLRGDVRSRGIASAQTDQRHGKPDGPRRGLRTRHAHTGVTWEFGRASCLLHIIAGRAGVPVDQEPWRWGGVRDRRRRRARHLGVGNTNRRVGGPFWGAGSSLPSRAGRASRSGMRSRWAGLAANGGDRRVNAQSPPSSSSSCSEQMADHDRGLGRIRGAFSASSTRAARSPRRARRRRSARRPSGPGGYLPGR